eukprot:7022892-Pyramimonas_sp.AAC.1
MDATNSERLLSGRSAGTLLAGPAAEEPGDDERATAVSQPPSSTPSFPAGRFEGGEETGDGSTDQEE